MKKRLIVTTFAIVLVFGFTLNAWAINNIVAETLSEKVVARLGLVPLNIGGKTAIGEILVKRFLPYAITATALDLVLDATNPIELRPVYEFDGAFTDPLIVRNVFRALKVGVPAPTRSVDFFVCEDEVAQAMKKVIKAVDNKNIKKRAKKVLANANKAKG